MLSRVWNIVGMAALLCSAFAVHAQLLNLPGTPGFPAAVAVDPEGNVFVGDGSSVRRIAISGNVFELPTTLANARGLGRIGGIAVDGAGNLYVSDAANNAVLRIALIGGIYQVPVKLPSGDGYNGPAGIAVDASGDLYVADANNDAIKRIPLAGGTYGTPETVPTGGTLQNPRGITLDAAGNLFVTGWRNGAVKRLARTGSRSFGPPEALPGDGALGFASSIVVDAAGDVLVGLDGSALFRIARNGAGYDEPLRVDAGFPVFSVTGLAVDSRRALYIADHTIRAVWQLVPAGSAYAPPLALPAGGQGYQSPGGIAADGQGNVFIADTSNAAIKRLANVGGLLREPGTLARTGLRAPVGIATDASGNLYFADAASDRVGRIERVAGAFQDPVDLPSGSGFKSPRAVAVDGAGNVYVADTGNNKVKKIALVGGAFQTPVELPSGSGFDHPQAVAVDAAGNVFVGDTDHNAVKMIALVGGVYQAPVELPPPAGTFGFAQPTALVVDPAGSVYVGSIVGITVSALNAGSYEPAVPLPNGAGAIAASALARDGNGNLYAADTNGAQMLALQGGVFLPAVPLPSSRGLYFPGGVVADAAGNVFVTDVSGLAQIRLDAGLYAFPVPMPLLGVHGSAALAIDAAGSLFVADKGDNTIKKAAVVGGVYQPSVTLVSGLAFPSGVAVADDGTVYYTELESVSASRLPFSGGAYQPPLALPSGTGFRNPTGIAVDLDGAVLVADYNHAAVKRIPLVGGVYQNPVTLPAAGDNPVGVAVDGTGTVYVGNSGVDRIVRVGSGYAVGTKLFGPGELTFPRALAWRAPDTLYVASGEGVTRVDVDAVGRATKLALGREYYGGAPIAYERTAFSLMVQALDASGTPRNVVTATTVLLSQVAGTGILAGPSTCTIPAGASTCVLIDLIYSLAEPGVNLGAVVTSGDTLNAGTTGPFQVQQLPATVLAVAAVNGGSNPTAGAPFDVVVALQDLTGFAKTVPYPLPVTLSRAAGTATLSGTLDCTIVAGESSCIVNGVRYGRAESGVRLQAGVRFATYYSLPSASFTVDAPIAASITPTRGAGQTALVGDTFSVALQATVRTSSGYPAPGLAVTFGAPAAGASATFGASATVVTDDSGVATAPPHVASGGVGSYVLTATVPGGTTSATFAETNEAKLSYSGSTATGSGTGTATLSGGGPGCTFATAGFVRAPAAAPTETVFPDGLFAFTTIGCIVGSGVTLTIVFPTAMAAGTRYWKYGPLPPGPAPKPAQWYALGATNGLNLSGHTATFTIVDGEIGDDDLAANGAIADAGGPGTSADSFAIPTLDVRGQWLLATLLLVCGALSLQRPRRVRRRA